MVRRKGNVPFLLVILAGLLGFLFWQKGGGQEGEKVALPSINAVKTDSLAENDSLSADQSIAESADSVMASSDSTAVLMMDATDTASSMGKTYHLLEVLKREEELVYRINGEEVENMLATIAELDYSKPFVLKIAGNVTYAEERSVKDVLDVKEIEYSEQAF